MRVLYSKGLILRLKWGICDTCNVQYYTDTFLVFDLRVTCFESDGVLMSCLFPG